MTPPHASRPDVFILVMDCVRSSDFPPNAAGEPWKGQLEQLRSESVEYSRAATVASWTIPSHASLFTGLYPWEHGVHNLGRTRLSTDRPTLASTLRSLGYRTLCLSGNAFLTPASGLVEGFETLGWGRWRDGFLRTTRRRTPAFLGSYEAAKVREGELGRPSLVAGLKPFAGAAFLEFPFFLDATNRVLDRVYGRPDGFRASPWIEGAFKDWVSGQSPSSPLFAFVNLMDAHDPYLTDSALASTVRDWWRLARVCQQPGEYYVNGWTPSDAEREALHELYLRGVRTACERAVELVTVLREEGRWDNTLFILTSDHGNAFDEEGVFFHGFKVIDPVARIPLWARFPRAEWGGASAKGWASLIDVFPTVLEEVGSPLPMGSTGVGLRHLIQNQRKGVVLAASDGVRPTVRRQHLVSLEAIRNLDRVWVAAYSGDRKVVYDATLETFSAFSTTPNGSCARDLWEDESSSLVHLSEEARAAGRRMKDRSLYPLPEGPEKRLASWGYV